MWLCRLLGHKYTNRAVAERRDGTWLFGAFCQRCGSRPDPEPGPCTAKWESSHPLLQSSLCGLMHGHQGAHKDPYTGMTWWIAPDGDQNVGIDSRTSRGGSEVPATEGGPASDDHGASLGERLTWGGIAAMESRQRPEASS